MNNRFKLYNVKMKYIRNLHNVDDNVPSVSPQISKGNRPFLGIVVMVNGSKYCIPLTSNSHSKQKKFQHMRESITFRKICDKDGRVLAGLNLNNMIPVRDEYIEEIDLRILPSDNVQTRKWKELCINELKWCRKNSDEIERLANALHDMYCSGEKFSKRHVCLNFPALERECNKAKKV